MKKTLVTGGTGFIGSHTCVEVIEAGWMPIVIDNLSNSSPRVVDRIEHITGKRPLFVEGDVRDEDLVRNVLKEHQIDAVVHFADLKAVGDSVVNPLRYYQNKDTPFSMSCALLRRPAG